MPILHVQYTPIDDEKRAALAAGITDAVVGATGCPADAVHILFRDVAPSHYAVGGKLNPEPGQAMLKIETEWFVGRKPKTAYGLAEGIRDAATRVLDIAADKVEVGFFELHRGNYTIAGQPIKQEQRRSPHL